jgi:chromosome segregation ATPase
MTPPRRPPARDDDDDDRGRVRQLEVERRELLGRLDESRDQLAEVQLQRATLQAANEQLEIRLRDTEARLGEAQQTLTQAQEQIRANAESLGRLSAIADTLDPVQEELIAIRAERDDLQRRLTEATTTLDARVLEQVEATVARLRTQHEEAAGEWERERKTLQDRIDALEQAPVGETQAIRAQDLAAEFRSVLEELAEPEVTDRPVGAALTGLEVEARGLIAPPAAGESLPRIITVGPTQSVDPAALSTVRLRFGLLPRLPTEVEPE